MRSVSALLLFLTAAFPVEAQDALQQRLLDLVAAGRKCEPVPSNGMLCAFKVGDKLSFTIKDVGGADTVVGFQHSGVSDRFYAVWYFDCVVVVPGEAHEPGYDRSYGAFVSPRTGVVYATREQCQRAQ